MNHYYDEQQHSPLKIYNIHTYARGRELDIYSASGIFSAKEIDNATNLLLDKCIVESGWNVLDLGCGNGIIGLTLALECKKCNIIMTDINKRAIMVARKNIKKYDLENVKALQGNLYEPIKEEIFDTIIVNPPYVAGREVCYKIIEEAKLHLKKSGLLQLVARHQKGGKMLQQKMQDVFGNVKVIAKQGGFRVYVSKLIC